MAGLLVFMGVSRKALDRYRRADCELSAGDFGIFGSHNRPIVLPGQQANLVHAEAGDFTRKVQRAAEESAAENCRDCKECAQGFQIHAAH